MPYFMGKDIFLSHIDVYGYTTLTLWSCGCNLRCPFCHNNALVKYDPSVCNEFESLEEIREYVEPHIEANKDVIDLIHLTGGEPTLSPYLIKLLYELSRKYNLRFSINSNLTTPQAGELVINYGDHVAFDIKLPWSISGRPDKIEFVQNFVNNIRKIIEEKPIEFEARIPVAKQITLRAFENEGTRKLLNLIKQWQEKTKGVIRIQPLLNEKYGLNPAVPEWCEIYCNPPEEELIKIGEKLKEWGLENVVIYDPRKKDAYKVL